MSTETITLTLDNDLDVTMSITAPPSLAFSPNNAMAFAAAVGTVAGGLTDYRGLAHKPSIESVELVGDHVLDDFGMGTADSYDVRRLFR